MKKILSMIVVGVLCLSACMLFTGCGGNSGGGSGTTDPWVKAYDEAWIRTHDIFGNPR